MDRSAVLQSPAYAALTPSGKRCLHLIEDEVARSGGAARIPRKGFMAVGISKAAVSFGIKQCERLGFVNVTVGLRHANVFVLLDDWRSLDADEAARRVKLARLPKPPRVAAPKPPKPTPASKPVKAEPPRMIERRVPSLPRLSFMDDGR